MEGKTLSIFHWSIQVWKRRKTQQMGQGTQHWRYLECPKHCNEGILCLVSAKPVQCVFGYHVSWTVVATYISLKQWSELFRILYGKGLSHLFPLYYGKVLSHLLPLYYGKVVSHLLFSHERSCVWISFVTRWLCHVMLSWDYTVLITLYPGAYSRDP